MSKFCWHVTDLCCHWSVWYCCALSPKMTCSQWHKEFHTLWCNDLDAVLQRASLADVNMHPWSATCHNYLQAIPCDPAGAHFNFAALSFNSEFLHQIHLIPLHGYSPAENQALCTLSAAEKCCQRLERETLSRVEGNWNDPYHNFPSRLPGDALWFTTVSHSTHTGYITPPTHPLSYKLSLCTLASCHMTCKSPVFNHICKQTCKTVLEALLTMCKSNSSSCLPSLSASKLSFLFL